MVAFQISLLHLPHLPHLPDRLGSVSDPSTPSGRFEIDLDTEGPTATFCPTFGLQGHTFEAKHLLHLQRRATKNLRTYLLCYTYYKGMTNRLKIPLI